MHIHSPRMLTLSINNLCRFLKSISTFFDTCRRNLSYFNSTCIVMCQTADLTFKRCGKCAALRITMVLNTSTPHSRITNCKYHLIFIQFVGKVFDRFRYVSILIEINWKLWIATRKVNISKYTYIVMKHFPINRQSNQNVKLLLERTVIDPHKKKHTQRIGSIEWFEAETTTLRINFMD